MVGAQRAIDRFNDAQARRYWEDPPMAIGPVEYMIVAFPGNQFKGEIAPALSELADSGTIRILDLALVMKDGEGNVSGFELEDAGSEVMQAFESLTAHRGGFVGEDDIEAAAEALPVNSSAAILVWEDLWATKIADAIANAGGEMIDIQRVPRDLVQAAVDYVEENRAATTSA
jgi:hypothetical protein